MRNQELSRFTETAKQVMPVEYMPVVPDVSKNTSNASV